MTGMSAEAQEARKAYQREYRRKNREKINAKRREWRVNNKNKVRQYNERYWEQVVEKKRSICS